jgi:AcrR family transcriptional regulator
MPTKPKTDKQRIILKTAASLFSRQGYAGTSMAQIARAAGIGKGTTYAYFSSKEDLFFKVFQWHYGRMEDNLSVNLAALGGTAAQRLMTMNDAIMVSWSEFKDMFGLVMEFWVASAAPGMRGRFQDAFRAAYDHFRDIVANLIKDGIAQGEFDPAVDPRALSAGVVGSWDAMLLQAWFDESFDPITSSRLYLEVFIKGLARETGKSV